MIHYKCRNSPYPSSNIKRLPVTDDMVSWTKHWPSYKPPTYTSKSVFGKTWADPDINDPKFKPKWNEIDNGINRISFTGKYNIVDKYPLNPVGRTGIYGRGLLGKWGPNHAADSIVTRWKRDDDGNVVKKDAKPVLQFCAIQRRDNKQWAIPGGMVDPGEKVSETLMREFQEEALNSLKANKMEKEQVYQMVKDFFQNGNLIYEGYVDDPRNTDNSWMETTAYNFHDEKGDAVGQFPFQAGDDAQNVTWMDISGNLDLYASHSYFVKKICEKRSAYW